MATAKIQDLATWEAWAIMLAEDAHLTGRARYIGEGVHGESLWQVPSKSSDGVYVVHIWPRTMDVTCNCTAGSHARACGHSSAVLLAERQRRAAERTSGQSEAWSWWMHGGSWD